MTFLGIRILVQVSWVHIWTRASTFSLPHLQFWWGWWLPVCMVDLVIHYGDPSHCCLFHIFPFYIFWSFVFSVTFCRLVLWHIVCLRLSLVRLHFVLGFLYQDHFCSGSPFNKKFLSVESDWFCYFCSSLFLILENVLGFGELVLLFNSLLLHYHQFYHLLVHRPFGYVPLSLVGLQADYQDLSPI